MSRRLPIGVATRCRPAASAGAVDRPAVRHDSLPAGRRPPGIGAAATVGPGMRWDMSIRAGLGASSGQARIHYPFHLVNYLTRQNAGLPGWTGAAACRGVGEDHAHVPTSAGVDPLRPRLAWLAPFAGFAPLLLRGLLPAASARAILVRRLAARPPPAQATSVDRRRPGQGRADPAADGRRQCRRRGAVHAQRRRDGAGRIHTPDMQLLVKDDGGNARGRAAGGPAGARRRRRDHPRTAVRAFGRRRSARSRARATCR